MSSLPAGRPQRLGATRIGQDVNFAVYSQHAERVELCLFDPSSRHQTASHELRASADGIWHGVLPLCAAGPGTHYAYRVHGPWDPANGHRFDARHLLLDPYARQFAPGEPVLGIVADTVFDWQNDVPPAVPWRDSLIYELHVKGFTRLHPRVPGIWQGKYLGLTVPAVIEHLQSLGVTAVELLPVQGFLSEAFLLERGLNNYWGYNPIAWFAPAPEYAVRDPVDEFKVMVRALHKAGIEVILDVVFNHTAEGNELGPTLSFKGLDNRVYYRLEADRRHYENLTGCGNTVNCEHPQVRALIIDCLKYWVEEMHVDGFRFDLGTVLARTAGGFDERSQFFAAVRAEPALAYVKLIAEPWDVGLGGYQLGRFPAGWSEWNDRYRDSMRAFWRGDPGKLGEFAERFAGSSDIFRHRARRPSASINFITAHDGFTLNDLVSYNERHNEANLENNADGHSHNLSCNHGAEGPSDDPAVAAVRLRQMKNLLAVLILSQGVPMLQAGDEFARSQGGNNNSYCQDNSISWVDWHLTAAQSELCEFVTEVCNLRRRAPQFRRDTFFEGRRLAGLVKDVLWLNARGGEMSDADWSDAHNQSLGILLAAQRDKQTDYLLLINAADRAVDFDLPAPRPGSGWVVCLDSTLRTAGGRSPPGHLLRFVLGPHSLVVLET